MKRIKLPSIVPMLGTIGLGLLACSAIAQTGQNTVSSGKSLAAVERAANLFGREVQSSDNQNIGKVNNLVVDLESEHILYVVLNTGKAKVAVPPQIFATTSTGTTLKVNADKQKIEGAPPFTSAVDKPGQLGQASFVDKVYQQFGQNPWWQGSAPANQGRFHNVHKLDQLIGLKIDNSNNNQPIGKVSNVVVDMPAGRVMYVVLAPDSSLNLGNNLYPVPSDALALSSDKSHLVVNIDQQKLASAPHFANNNWPNLTDPSFASQIYQFYGKQAWFGNAGTGTPLQPTGR